MSDALLETVSLVWGFHEFRPSQREVAEALLAGRDCLVLRATGSGKSLGYQLFAVESRKRGARGLTLVISPLLALMEDQVRSLAAHGVAAEYLGSTQRDEAGVLRRARCGEIALLYVTPERASGLVARSELGSILVSAIIFDEAHCVSEWGHDFRPAYLAVGRLLRRALPQAPVAAVTATATRAVRAEICASLALGPAHLKLVGSFDRPNLEYSARRLDPRAVAQLPAGSPAWSAELRVALAEFARKAEGSCLVYAQTRADAERACAVAQQEGVTAAFYHAGLTPLDRRDVARRFQADEVACVCATVAFGMGVDKPDVRLVVHVGLPAGLAQYAQESGRAGRDGRAAKATLLFAASDAARRARLFAATDASSGVQRRDRLELAAMERYARPGRARPRKS